MPEGAFNGAFAPVGRRGNVLHLSPQDEYRLIRAVNYNPGVNASGDGVDFSGVANGDESKNEMTAIELDDGFIGQFRLPQLPDNLPDGTVVRVDHEGRQAPMFTTKNVRGDWDNETGAVYSWDPNGGNVVQDHQSTAFTELFVQGDQAPYFTFDNDSGGPASWDPRFVGYVYDVETLTREEAEQRQGSPIDIPVGNIGTA